MDSTTNKETLCIYMQGVFFISLKCLKDYTGFKGLILKMDHFSKQYSIIYSNCLPKWCIKVYAFNMIYLLFWVDIACFISYKSIWLSFYTWWKDEVYIDICLLAVGKINIKLQTLWIVSKVRPPLNLIWILLIIFAYKLEVVEKIL